MGLDAIKQRLQNHFTDGLVTVVGCGLSSAEGLPSMRELGICLKAEIPGHIKGADEKIWKEIDSLLEKGSSIEDALLQHPPGSTLEAQIIAATSRYILTREMDVIGQVVSGAKVLRFTRLLKHMLKPKGGIPVITTNYDRLIEVAAEMAGLGVDTLFVGHHFGRLSEKESRMSFCRDVSLTKGHARLEYAHKVMLLKPHGSLDWFLHNGEPIRCPLALCHPRLVITPGLNKFRTGYDRPFDTHREKANECIDRGTRFLVLGYGFNDDHLQTHLAPKLRDGAPTLILTKQLSEKARALIAECAGLIALVAPDEPGLCGTQVLYGSESEYVPDVALWDLNVFVQEVLEP